MRRLILMLGILVVASIILVGCNSGPSDEDVAASAEARVAMTSAALPTNTLEPLATNTLIPSPTQKGEPSSTPTEEPTAAPTQEPTATPTQEPTSTLAPGTGPRDGVPLCSEHDPTAWHEVYNAELDCHNDHHHGRDPYDPAIVALLGSPDEYTEQGISYPWETPDENAYKHRAYFWLWQINDECVDSTVGVLCVAAYRTQLHGDMGILGAKTRFHSYWFEMVACETGTDNCGTLRFGGTLDYGCLYDAYFGEPNPLPVDPPVCRDFVNRNPYRVLNKLSTKQQILDFYESGNWPAPAGTNNVSAADRIIWANAQVYTDYGAETMDHLVFNFLDGWALAEAGNADNWEYLCEDFQCPFNGSLGTIANFNTHNQPIGSDSYWTDERGIRNDACVETGPECIPYVRENWPLDNVNAGYHRVAQYAGLNYHPRDLRTMYEFDQSPAQIGTGTEWWLVPTDHEPLP